jgi:glycosyltransferase involved in cell wall biosynthesis
MLAGRAIAAYIIGKLRGKPVLIKIAGAGVTGDIGTSQRSIRGRFKLWLFKRLARWVVCPSQRTYQEIKTVGIPEVSLRVIPNGVRMDRFQPLPAADRSQRRASLQIGDNDLVALYVGRWAAGKGLEALLTIWDTAQSQPDFHWKLRLVVSQAPPAEHQALLRRLESSVQVIVRSSDPLPYYQTADLAVLLSENEGLSNFLLEAMASGLPLLTTPGAAVAPVEEAVRWGWLASSSRAGDILALLKTIQKDTVLLKSKGDVARKEAGKHYSTETVAAEYEKLYVEILKN